MPSHPDRVRTAPLPSGYQFGDASLFDLAAGLAFRIGAIEDFAPWRAPHENAADRLAQSAKPVAEIIPCTWGEERWCECEGWPI